MNICSECDKSFKDFRYKEEDYILPEFWAGKVDLRCFECYQLFQNKMKSEYE